MLTGLDGVNGYTVLPVQGGFGLNGLWAATHGEFAVRSELRESRKEIRQNADHG